MRLYIRKSTNGPRCPEYEFAKSIEAALYWDTGQREWVDRVFDLISHEGITVNQPFGRGMMPCSDFRIEPRPQGGLVISCEVPA